MTLTISARVLAALTLAAATVGGPSTSASADPGLVTRCSGTAGAVTVPGDLVVPAGASCVLDGTTITGGTHVAAGASLIVTNGTFGGDIQLADDAYLDAVETSISGRIVNRDGYGAYLEGTTAGTYLAPLGADTFLTAFESELATVRADAGSVLLESSTLTGNLAATGTRYTDLVDTWVSGSVTISGAVQGSAFCGSEIDRDATLTDNAGVQIGLGDLLSTCAESVYIGGDVDISGSTIGTALGGVVIRGDLTGTANDPAPTLADVRVRGDLGGQFAQPSTAALAALPTAVTADRPDASAAVQERKEAALAQAAAAGPAAL